MMSAAAMDLRNRPDGLTATRWLGVVPRHQCAHRGDEGERQGNAAAALCRR